MTVWFTADPHFGHDNIREHCARPFASVHEMDDAILDGYRERIGKRDELWILGDFAIAKEADGGRERIARIFRAIPGRKHLIIGNHDRTWVLQLGWTSVEHFAEIKVDGRRLSLSHYPMLTFPGARHGALQLFGHVHNNWTGSRNSINVGVDLWQFRPVTLDEIDARARTLPVNPLWSAVEPACPMD